jgi:hypothetical protein
MTEESPKARLFKLFLTTLRQIEEFDVAENYGQRNLLIYQAMYLASRFSMLVGIRIDSAEPTWPVIFIELPTGQVSWHVAEHSIVWDGHTTQQKYTRIHAYLETV